MATRQHSGSFSFSGEMWKGLSSWSLNQAEGNNTCFAFDQGDNTDDEYFIGHDGNDSVLLSTDAAGPVTTSALSSGRSAAARRAIRATLARRAIRVAAAAAAGLKPFSPGQRPSGPPIRAGTLIIRKSRSSAKTRDFDGARLTGFCAKLGGANGADFDQDF